MQDRFKFRVWHVPTKTMYEVYEFTKDCILIQCTGLKDKNGKLIYEGNVVKYMYYNPKRYTKWTVVFDQNTLEFGLKNSYGGYLRITRYSILNNKVEIIGNIYENPEVIGGVK